MKKILMIVLMIVVTGLFVYADVPDEIVKEFNEADIIFNDIINDFNSKNDYIIGSKYVGQSPLTDKYGVIISDDIELISAIYKDYTYNFKTSKIVELGIAVQNVYIYYKNRLLYIRTSFNSSYEILYERYNDVINFKKYERTYL